jgi:NTE family protein
MRNETAGKSGLTKEKRDEETGSGAKGESAVKEKQKADAVFQGGGVRGIAFVGAVARVEQDYDLQNLAGTSAGAIIAGLLAAGWNAADIESELSHEGQYTKFMDEDGLDKVPLVGKPLSFVFEFGIYRGRFFERWMSGLLAKKGKTRFKDLPRPEPGPNDDTLPERLRKLYASKVQMIATDLSDRRMLVLPRDLDELVAKPDDFPIARAVRMSMSIPGFFEPARLKDKRGKRHVIVDGGVMSNYPVWLLDDGTPDPAWPTFGFKLTSKATDEPGATQTVKIANAIDYLKSLWDTMFSAVDRYDMSANAGDLERSILIPTEVVVNGVTKTITTTGFGITQEESRALYQNGWDAADKFLKTWNFEDWKAKYRKPK